MAEKVIQSLANRILELERISLSI